MARSELDWVLSPDLRVAAFDCDGTLWAGDSGRDFFYWGIAQGLLGPERAPRELARYEAYLRGELDEETICADMVRMYEGLLAIQLTKQARYFFHRFIVPQIYPEFRRLISHLMADGVEVWLVSSTNTWVIEAAAEWFRIPCKQVVAASTVVRDGRVSDELLQVPTGKAKASRFLAVAGRPPDVAFGNTMHDAALLALARRAVAVHPDQELLALATENGWPVYRPALSELLRG